MQRRPRCRLEKEEKMAQATSISFSKFLASVQSAVKAAVAKNPKFKVDVPNALTVSYLIRGIPVPEAILSTVTISETQAFATDIAAQIAGASPEVLGTAAPGPGSRRGDSVHWPTYHRGNSPCDPGRASRALARGSTCPNFVQAPSLAWMIAGFWG